MDNPQASLCGTLRRYGRKARKHLRTSRRSNARPLNPWARRRYPVRLAIFNWAPVGVLVLAIGSATLDVSAQEVAPAPLPAPPVSDELKTIPDADETSEALKRLAAAFAERRAALSKRRQALARQHDLLEAIDRPASEEEIARWRGLNATGDRLERDIDTLRGLLQLLTPESLLEVTLQQGSEASPLRPDPDVLRTSIEVNLRAAPQQPPIARLKAGTLVVQLANDGAGRWSLVATTQGIGFVPSSQLRKDP